MKSWTYSFLWDKNLKNTKINRKISLNFIINYQTLVVLPWYRFGNFTCSWNDRLGMFLRILLLGTLVNDLFTKKFQNLNKDMTCKAGSLLTLSDWNLYMNHSNSLKLNRNALKKDCIKLKYTLSVPIKKISSIGPFVHQSP